MNEPRVPAGVPTGGQFAAQSRAESGVTLITVPAKSFEVQAEPLLLDHATLSRLRSDGTLTSVVAVQADEWARCRDDEARDDLLARTQVAHAEPYWLAHEILAVHDGQMLVEVTNNLHVWASDDDAVDAYNAEVAPTDRLTPEQTAWLRAAGHTAASGSRAVYDLDDYEVGWSEWGSVRVTPCCGASAKGVEDGVACRSCYGDIDPSIGALPRLLPVPASEARS